MVETETEKNTRLHKRTRARPASREKTFCTWDIAVFFSVVIMSMDNGSDITGGNDDGDEMNPFASFAFGGGASEPPTLPARPPGAKRKKINDCGESCRRPITKMVDSVLL